MHHSLTGCDGAVGCGGLAFKKSDNLPPLWLGGTATMVITTILAAS